VYFLSAYGGSLYGGKEKRLFCKVQEAMCGERFWFVLLLLVLISGLVKAKPHRSKNVQKSTEDKFPEM